MSAAESGIAPSILPAPRWVGTAHSAAVPRVRLRWSEILLVAACAALACAFTAIALGRDLNWDYFNYHGYAALLALGGRTGQDFFPAGYQGYLNPLPFLPFALMQHAGWHSMAIAAVLAAIQSLNVLFLYLIAREVTVDAPYPRRTAAVLSVLGCASGVFASQIGSTFVDPTTTPPVIAGLWLLVRYPGRRAACAATALAGAAVALKLTNAPFALGMMAAVIVRQGLPFRRVGYTTVMWAATAGLVGFTALYGHWGWRLMKEFGSPVFPLFNHLFGAQDFPAQSVTFQRFVPQSLWQALALPFQMVELRSWIYTEIAAPDLRPVALIGLAIASVVMLATRRTARVARHTGRSDSRTPLVLFGFFIPALLAWVVTSTNGRYAIPLLLLLGPLIYLAAVRVVGLRHASVVCLLLLALQVLHVVSAGNPRWNPRAWSPEWLPVAVPPALAAEPRLFVSIGQSSESYLAAYVHRDSVFTNPIGLISLANGAAGWQRFVALRDGFSGRTQVVFQISEEAARAGWEGPVGTYNAMVDRLGLAIETSFCQLIVVNSNVGVIPPPQQIPTMHVNNRYLLSCAAQPKLRPDATLQAGRAKAAEIMDAFEHKCPHLFAPNGVQVEGTGRIWTRYYGNFDLYLRLDLENGPIQYRMEHQATAVTMGNIATWQTDLVQFNCMLPHNGSRNINTMITDANR